MRRSYHGDHYMGTTSVCHQCVIKRHAASFNQGRIKHLVGPTHFTMPGPNPSVDRRVRWMRRAPGWQGAPDGQQAKKLVGGPLPAVSCLPVNAALPSTVTITLMPRVGDKDESQGMGTDHPVSLPFHEHHPNLIILL